MSRIELRHIEFLAIASAIGEIRNAELRQHLANKVFEAVWLHAPSRLAGGASHPNDGATWFEACRAEHSK